jgi:hypothetical protein
MGLDLVKYIPLSTIKELTKPEYSVLLFESTLQYLCYFLQIIGAKAVFLESTLEQSADNLSKVNIAKLRAI